ncbi:MAG: pitrilysin family protein [Acidobacteriia bacterium]|nr:pitrilysin family protein [Terriglobia bacterium]
MHRRSLRTALLLALGLSAITWAQSTPVHLPLQQRNDLLNGLKVVVVEREKEAPATVLLVTFVGAGADESGKNGTALLTARMLLASTTQRKSPQIAEDLAEAGFHSSSYADYDASWFRLTGPAKDVGAMLEQLGDLVLNSDFDPAELAKVKATAKQELVDIHKSAAALADFYFHEKLFEIHPYGYPPQGSPHTLDAITPKDCQTFYKRYYHPNNAILVVTGPVNSEDVLNRARVVLGGWRNVPVAAGYGSRPAKQPIGIQIRIVDRPAGEPSEIRLGRIGAARGARDHFTLELMNFVFGGEGTPSRLVERLQKQDGLTKNVASAFEYHLLGGDWVVHLSTETAKAPQAVSDILDEIKKFRATAPTETQLTQAVSTMTARMAAQLQTNDQISDAIAQLEIYSLSLDAYSAYAPHLSRITPEQIQQSAREYLDPDSLVVIVTGPSEQLRPALEKIGRVEVFPGT